MRHEAVLSPSETAILQKSITDPNYFTDYFFRPVGATQGWRFDDNFRPDGAWQLNMHQAAQKDITIIGGFGTGKTSGVGMSAVTWATLTSDFKFLNVAPTAWQAKQMYDGILTQARNTRFEDLIWEKPRRPYPKIIIRYRIGAMLYESSCEFMSADKDAVGVLTWEGDWLHIDESGLIDTLSDVITNVGSRLRGSIRGRERLGRFSMTSNSWDNFDLWSYFDQAVADPNHFLSIVVSSRDNLNITDDQLARMLARIPEEERSRFIEGTRPEGRGNYFSRDSVYGCEDPHVGEIAEEKYKKEVPFYVVRRTHGVGIYDYEVPANATNMYMTFGDPGVDGAPRRNAPCIMTWDVTNFPAQPARLVQFWWGNGGGKIGPFVDKLLGTIEKYKPTYAGIDSTGTQKNMAYLINEHLFREKFTHETDEGEISAVGYVGPLGIVSGIGGLDFSGSRKAQYLQAARLLVEAKLLSWPKAIVGMRSQLTNYDAERDKRIAQDIVATISMSAHAIRTYFHVSPQELLSTRTIMEDKPLARNRRSPSTKRQQRAKNTRAAVFHKAN